MASLHCPVENCTPTLLMMQAGIFTQCCMALKTIAAWALCHDSILMPSFLSARSVCTILSSAAWKHSQIIYPASFVFIHILRHAHRPIYAFTGLHFTCLHFTASMVWRAGKAMWKAIYSFPVVAYSSTHQRKSWMGKLCLHAVMSRILM